MSRIIRRDRFGSLQIIVDLFSIQQSKYPLSTGMHKILVDIIHAIIYDDVTYSSGLEAVEFVLLVQKRLVDLVVVFIVTVFVSEE